jgi:hypothetical protein
MENLTLKEWTIHLLERAWPDGADVAALAEGEIAALTPAARLQFITDLAAPLLGSIGELSLGEGNAPADLLASLGAKLSCYVHPAKYGEPAMYSERYELAGLFPIVARRLRPATLEEVGQLPPKVLIEQQPIAVLPLQRAA